jgi:hypothetical protein
MGICLVKNKYDNLISHVDNFYDLEATSIDGELIHFKNYKEKKCILIVN